MHFVYDSTFPGLLTVVFTSYAEKWKPDQITPKKRYCPGLFSAPYEVHTDEIKAKRVAKKLQCINPSFLQLLYRVFLSEDRLREMLIYRLIQLALTKPESVKGDFRNPDLLRAKELNKQIGREVHRMHAFVRFQHTKDDLWFAAIAPDFDVMPLIGEHFEKRYADQQWLIYDTTRRYGLHYDLEKTRFVELDIEKTAYPEKLTPAQLHAEEDSYQDLWRTYFQSVNITARNNLKLHLRHLPRRYWRFLTEK